MTVSPRTWGGCANLGDPSATRNTPAMFPVYAATHCPSALNATEPTGPLCGSTVVDQACLPVSAAKRWRALSPPPAATHWPSGLKATAQTPPTAILAGRGRSVPVAASNTTAAELVSAAATHRESGLNARLTMLYPGTVQRTAPVAASNTHTGCGSSSSKEWMVAATQVLSGLKATMFA